MPYDFKAFRQDLLASIKALEEEDFRNMNIYSNRIMGNAIFGDNGKLALPGFFLKEIALVVGNIKTLKPTAPFSTAKTLATKYTNELFKQTNQPNFNEIDLWTQYHEFLNEIRKFTMDSLEEKAYTSPNQSFTREAFDWLISFLDKHKDILNSPKNLLLKGIINEMNRLYKVHGVQLIDIYSMSLITALSRCNDYIEISARSESDFEKKVKTEILPYVEKTVLILRQKPPDIHLVNDLLWTLIRVWREYFIQYMERGLELRVVSEPEKTIELPEETRKKLTETITKSLEKDVRPKK